MLWPKEQVKALSKIKLTGLRWDVILLPGGRWDENLSQTLYMVDQDSTLDPASNTGGKASIIGFAKLVLSWMFPRPTSTFSISL